MELQLTQETPQTVPRKYVMSTKFSRQVVREFRKILSDENKEHKKELAARKVLTEKEAKKKSEKSILNQLMRTFTEEQFAKIDKYCLENFKRPAGTYNINKLTRLSSRASYIGDLKRDRVEGGVSEATSRGLLSEEFIMLTLNDSTVIDAKRGRIAHTQSNMQASMKICGTNTSFASKMLAKYPNLLDCHIDMLLQTKLGVIINELKSTQLELPKDSSELSEAHTCQIQSYMMLTELPRAYAIFTHCGNEASEEGEVEIIDNVQVVKVEENRDTQRMIKDGLVAFWASILQEIDHPTETEKLSTLCDEIVVIDNALSSIANRIKAVELKYIIPLQKKIKGLRTEKELLKEKAKAVPEDILKAHNGFLGKWKISHNTAITYPDEKAITTNKKYKNLEAISYTPFINKNKIKQEKVYQELIDKGLVKVTINTNISVKPRT